MTKHKVDVKVVEGNKEELEFITREELLSIIATPDSLEKIFKIQEIGNPAEITEDMIADANKQMGDLVTVAQVIQIAGMLNETTRDNFTRNLSGLFDTLQIQKLILQKLGATPEIEKEARDTFLADKEKRMAALEEAQKKAQEEADKKAEEEAK